MSFFKLLLPFVLLFKIIELFEFIFILIISMNVVKLFFKK